MHCPIGRPRRSRFFRCGVLRTFRKWTELLGWKRMLPGDWQGRFFRLLDLALVHRGHLPWQKVRFCIGPYLPFLRRHPEHGHCKLLLIRWEPWRLKLEREQVIQAFWSPYQGQTHQRSQLNLIRWFEYSLQFYCRLWRKKQHLKHWQRWLGRGFGGQWLHNLQWCFRSAHPQ